MGEVKQSSLGRYCEIATCMGITDCYLTKSPIGKLFWSILIITGLTVTVGQTYLYFIQYLSESDFSVSVSLQASDGIKFPNITICNFNRAKQSLINSSHLDPRVLPAMFQLFPTNYDMPLSVLDPTTLSAFQNAFTQYQTQTNDFSIQEFYRKYGHNYNESILSMSFGSLYIPYTVTETWTVFGRCWKIDINSTQTLPGPIAGLKLILNPQLNEYMTNVVFNNFFQQGFAISLSYDDEPLVPDAIMLSPGTSSNIMMKATQNTFTYTQFPTKKVPCRKDTDLKIINAEYTPTNCICECFMQSINDSCGCILLVETRNPTVRICNMSETLTCASPNPLDPIQSLLWRNNIGLKNQDCVKNCQYPCTDLTSIDATLSTTKTNIIDQDQAYQILKYIGRGAWSDEYIADASKNSIMAKIYFTTTNINVVATGETTPIMTFIGNVGGQLGLWMGISMLSVIQVLYYFFVGFINGEFFCKDRKVEDNRMKIPGQDTPIYYVM